LHFEQTLVPLPWHSGQSFPLPLLLACRPCPLHAGQTREPFPLHSGQAFAADLSAMGAPSFLVLLLIKWLAAALLHSYFCTPKCQAANNLFFFLRSGVSLRCRHVACPWFLFSALSDPQHFRSLCSHVLEATQWSAALFRRMPVHRQCSRTAGAFGTSASEGY
jgi:hypothetical protein